MKNSSNVLRLVLAVCVFLQIALFLATWLDLLPHDLFFKMSARGMSAADLGSLTPAQRLAAAALALPGLLALCHGLWRLRRVLANVERQAIFALDTIAHLRRFAGAVLAATLLAIVEVPVRMVLLSAGFARSDILFTIGVSFDQVLLLVVCALFYVVIRIMHEGRRLAEENEGFV